LFNPDITEPSSNAIAEGDNERILDLEEESKAEESNRNVDEDVKEEE